MTAAKWLWLLGYTSWRFYLISLTFTQSFHHYGWNINANMYKRKQLPVSRIFVDLVFHCVTRMLLTKKWKIWTPTRYIEHLQDTYPWHYRDNGISNKQTWVSQSLIRSSIKILVSLWGYLFGQNCHGHYFYAEGLSANI